jgi:hypothetical protein
MGDWSCTFEMCGGVSQVDIGIKRTLQTLRILSFQDVRFLWLQFKQLLDFCLYFTSAPFLARQGFKAPETKRGL